MIFHTRNSTYEVDHDTRRVRRLSGVNDPTPYQGTDGEWKTFHELTQVPDRLTSGSMGLGYSYLIAWDATGRGTWTSTVMEEA